MPHVLLQLVLTLAVVIALGQAMGRLFRVIGQPPVVGEVLAGIALGPSLLGWAAPGAYALILPPTVVPALELVSYVGVVLYMFLVGLELNPERVSGRLGATVAIAETGMAVPFVLGAALATFLYPDFADPGVPFASFALFVGVAMSITAFPVLARILSDHRLTRTELGAVALSSAAIADVTAWCLLAFVVGVVRPGGPGAGGVVAATAAFVGVMLVVVRPLATRLADVPPGGANRVLVTIGVLAAAGIAAAVSEAIGVHAIFGAFMLGAVMPADSSLARLLQGRFERTVTMFLLPAFFALTGLRTEIGLLADARGWATAVFVILIATAGKFGSTAVAARLTGLEWRTSAALGVLMNTRGLMEIIVLNVGLALGVISPRLFTIFVVMAIVTSVATTPLLKAVVDTTGTKRSR